MVMGSRRLLVRALPVGSGAVPLRNDWSVVVFDVQRIFTVNGGGRCGSGMFSMPVLMCKLFEFAALNHDFGGGIAFQIMI